MFSRFETENGAIYIRSTDMRRIEDRVSLGTMLVWDECGTSVNTRIMGTADENMERLRAEETAMLVASEQLRQRQANGLPSIPVRRGRQ